MTIQHSWIVLIVFLLAGCAKKINTSSVKSELKISSMAPVVPVIKGLSSNPMLRIAVYIPAGYEQMQFTGIACTLNREAVEDIAKLEVYFTDTEPLFATNNLSATITQLASTMEIPVNMSMKPGMHYVWFSVTLKPSADLEDKIEMHAKELLSAAGNSGRAYVIKEDGGAYSKRIGIAVRKQNDDGVHSYRIPGITVTDKGTLIAVYDIRYKNSGDLPGNIDVGMSRSTDGGQTWSPMKVIMDMGEPHDNNGVGDPAVLFDPQTKKLWVTALWSKGNKSIAGSRPGLTPDETGQFAMVSSNDDGLTWTTPYSITAQVKNPAWNLFFNGPGNGIAMKDGKLVFAAQYWNEKAIPHSTIIYSADHGQTWKSADGPKSNTTESQVIETTPGTLMLNMRDNRGSFRSVAVTSNMGGNWVEHHTSYNALPDPVCMASFVKLPVQIKAKQQEVVFFSNPATQNGRYNMTVKASLDLGESWNGGNELLYDERRGFGYSAITGIDDHHIGILYEGNRDLYFVRIPVDEIIK
jgi:sialidase-1